MEKDEIEIDLKEVFGQIWSYAFIIVLASAIGAMLMYYASSALMNKKFQSSTSVYVLNQQDNQTVTYTDLQSGTQLTKDYAQLIKSRTVTTKVIAELDLQNKYDDMANITPDSLAGMITVTALQDTRIIKITVTDTDPYIAQDIANAVREAASVHISDVMDIEAVNVVDDANLPEAPVSPNPMKNAIIGALLGFILSVGIVVVVFLMDDTIKNPDDVERYLGLSVLASIPFDESMAAGTKGKKKKSGSRKAAKKLPSIR